MYIYEMKLEETCLALETGSELNLRELVEPILLDIEPSNLWESCWCWWRAMERACLCNNSSSAINFLCDRLLALLLLDPTSFVSFFDMQMNRFPILNTPTRKKKKKSTLERLKITEKSRSFLRKWNSSELKLHSRKIEIKGQSVMTLCLFQRERESEVGEFMTLYGLNNKYWMWMLKI